MAPLMRLLSNVSRLVTPVCLLLSACISFFTLLEVLPAYKINLIRAFPSFDHPLMPCCPQFDSSLLHQHLQQLWGPFLKSCYRICQSLSTPGFAMASCHFAMFPCLKNLFLYLKSPTIILKRQKLSLPLGGSPPSLWHNNWFPVQCAMVTCCSYLYHGTFFAVL